MKKLGVILLAFFVISCAKVSVETKKPIRVDISMRVDIYQHVVKDIEDINGQIYGNSGKDLNYLFGFEEAYAVDFSVDTSAAISRRRERVESVEVYFTKGYIGENKDAFMELRGDVSGKEKAAVRKIILAENKDREIIYKAIADKNGTDILSVRKVSFESDYKRAPSGYWFQVSDGGGYTWEKK